MRSSTGEHFVGLDHVRAVAAFLVFAWHFLHIHDGHLRPLPGTFDFWGFSLLAEGHTGVSLFMVLSGYLFAKITQGKTIDYRRFFAARALRLLPLLISVCLVVLLRDWVLEGERQAGATLIDIAYGVIYPSLPNGGWSITVEAHFYILFPIILLASSRYPAALPFLIVLALLGRLFIYAYTDLALQLIAYPTILGRLDQFLLGMMIARYRSVLRGRHVCAALTFCALIGLYGWFDRLGGWYSNYDHPGIWIYLLTVEGIFYALLIGWYDTSFSFSRTGVSGLLAKIGAASYSLYLLHFFVVFEMAELIDQHIVVLDSFYQAALAALICFGPMSVLAWLSYRYFELFWLRFRVPYMRETASVP
ncbi:MAG: acyltransferase [Pseudomonadota bacterium]